MNDVPDGKAEAQGRPVDRVLAWLRARFAERPEGWTAGELMPLARAAGHDLCTWFECPEVADAIDRTQYAELWPGRLEPVWRLKGGDATGAVEAQL